MCKLSYSRLGWAGLGWARFARTSCPTLLFSSCYSLKPCISTHAMAWQWSSKWNPWPGWDSWTEGSAEQFASTAAPAKAEARSAKWDSWTDREKWPSWNDASSVAPSPLDSLPSAQQQQHQLQHWQQQQQKQHTHQLRRHKIVLHSLPSES